MRKSIYKVEKNIPIPSRYIKWSKFPFVNLSVNESFFVPLEKEKQTSLLQLRSHLWKKSTEFNIDTSNNYKFSFHIEREKKGVRVFRIN